MDKKNFRRTIISGILVLAVSAAALIGTTFAMFNDNSSTGINIIQAGTLDVALVDGSGNSLVGETLGFVDDSGTLLGNILWQPGETYKLQPIYIKNNGDLDFVYKIVVDGLEGQAALNTYMSWTVKVNGVETEIANFEQTLAAGAANVKVELIGTLSTETPVTMMGESAQGITLTVYAKQTTAGATYDEA